MLNYWWVTRPKRKLDSVPEILRCCAAVAQSCEWQGNTYTHLKFEEELEKRGLKRVGERKDQRGGGGRTYFAWLSSLGLVYLQDNTGRTYDHDNNETTAEIPTPDAKLRIRNLTPGTNITVFNSNGTAAFPTLGYWLDWKDAEAFDPDNKETYYGFLVATP